jgi:hypothetical protein
MKKILVTLFIILGFYGISHAQRRGDLQFGITVGGNVSYVQDGDYNTSSALGGFNAGLSADYYFSRTWSLKVEARYDQKGFGGGTLYDDQGNDIGDNVNFRLNYVTVPVLASVHFGYNREWYVDFGPYVSFLTTATATNYGNEDVKSSFNNTDGGFDVAIGVKLPISPRAKFFIELGGEAGVGNVFSGGYGSSVQNYSNNLNVGINF